MNHAVTEFLPDRVLNTRSGKPRMEVVKVRILISDYAKLRGIARATNSSIMAVLEKTLERGVRRLSSTISNG